MNETPQHELFEPAPLLTRNARLALWALVALGAAAFFFASPARAWQIYLVNWLFWSGLAVVGVVIAAIWRVTNAQWSRPLRGIALATVGFVPAAFVLFLPLAAAKRYIFPWMGHTPPHRAVWMEPNFVLWRNFVALLVFYAAAAVYAYFLLRPHLGAANLPADASLAGRLRAFVTRNWQGFDAEQARAERILRRMTTPLLILYTLVMSLVAFDLVMPVDPRFASTLFGGYYFVTILYTGWALIAVLVALWLKREPRLAALITSDELHQLGKLVFGFCMLYGMVFWSQYLVWWYGNLLEEIPYVMLRQNTMPWSPISYGMALITLPLPFAILLSVAVKKNPRTLAAVCGLIVAGMWLERWVLVVPSLWTFAQGAGGEVAHAAVAEPAAAPVSLPLGPVELLITLGFAAAFLLSYAAFARAFPITLGIPPRETH